MAQNMDELVELLPVDDVFITGLGHIQSLGDGMVRTVLTVNDGGTQIVKVRLIIPVRCALQINHAAAPILAAEFRKYHGLKPV